jgi:hypothetical protein
MRTARRSLPGVLLALALAACPALVTAADKQETRMADREFVRKTYLEYTGAVPTREQVQAFVRSEDPQKRSKLIEQLKRAARAATPAPAAAAKTTEGKKTFTPAAKTPFQPDTNAQSLAARIDEAVAKKLEEAKLPPSPLADDAEFLRRVSLDITGVIPTAEKAKEFLESKDPNKRARLIDELLASPAYGKHQADTWEALLIPHTSDNRRLREESFDKWLEESFNANKPWDKFVRELLTATGDQEKNGATTYFVANPTADKLTDSVCKVFLGVQLQCAQCHNHPFTDWKQNEYWAMAAFFSKVRLQGNPKAAAKNGTTVGVNEEGKGRQRGLPESAKTVPAKFLGGEEPKLSTGEPYRPVLADWMTSPKNPWFARAMVNRTWAQLFGKGFVNPVDDMLPDRPPSHPELLQELADQFAAGGFDLKNLIRAVCNSQTYQRSSHPLSGNKADAKYFSHMAVKVMSPEQLFDSLVQVVGRPESPGKGGGKAAGGKGGPRNPREQFVAFFGIDDGTADPTAYQAGIPQALRLMNSAKVVPPAAVRQLVPAGTAPAQAIDKLYLATLSRHPTADERQRLLGYVGKTADPAAAYGDVLWALLNSSEFQFNR